MKITNSFQIVLVVVIISFVGSACSMSSPAEPTVPPATNTPEPEPTATTEPTSTPRPTKTPNLAATQAMEEVQERIQGYVDNGYLPSTSGRLHSLDDVTRDMAMINYLDYEYAGFDNQIDNFAAWADITWESAGPVNYPEYSGCGFTYRFNEDNGDAYTAMVTNDSVLLTYCDSSIRSCGRIGTTRGKGTLDLGNPASVHFEIIVNSSTAYALVDGEFIGEYTLLKDKLISPGFFLYSIISGTNRDYGTRCEFSNANIWVMR